MRVPAEAERGCRKPSGHVRKVCGTRKISWKRKEQLLRFKTVFILGIFWGNFPAPAPSLKSPSQPKKLSPPGICLPLRRNESSSLHCLLIGLMLLSFWSKTVNKREERSKHGTEFKQNLGFLKSILVQRQLNLTDLIWAATFWISAKSNFNSLSPSKPYVLLDH